MKKLNPLFLILLTISLVACGNADSEVDTADLVPAAAAATSPDTNSKSPIGLVSLNYSLSFNYARIKWSASYVESAFIRVPTNSQFADPIPFSQFVGQTNNPSEFAPLANETDLLGKLADSPLTTGLGSLPANYCKIPRVGVQGVSSEECYATNPNTRAQNYIDVMIPLNGDQASHAGLIKFRLPAKQNVFTIYYRDWANQLKKKEIKVVRPS